MTSGSERPRLAGELYTLPFEAGNLGQHVGPVYDGLVAAYGIEDVLVLERLPTGTDRIRDALADVVDS